MIEYKGYKAGQASNHHVWITKDGRMVLHSQCNKTKTDGELRKMVDNYIEIFSDNYAKDCLMKIARCNMKEFIEKLIGRLEEKQDEYFHGKSDYEEGKYNAYDEVAQIVNQLAEEYNGDFCEWFKYDYRTIAPKYHDVGNPYWRIPENMDKLKHCPYCGKKIKVVE